MPDGDIVVVDVLRVVSVLVVSRGMTDPDIVVVDVPRGVSLLGVVDGLMIVPIRIGVISALVGIVAASDRLFAGLA
jgi:hypothetical protein